MIAEVSSLIPFESREETLLCWRNRRLYLETSQLSSDNGISSRPYQHSRPSFHHSVLLRRCHCCVRSIIAASSMRICLLGLRTSSMTKSRDCLVSNLHSRLWSSGSVTNRNYCPLTISSCKFVYMPRHCSGAQYGICSRCLRNTTGQTPVCSDSIGLQC